MINSIIKGISIALDAEFSEKEYEIHMEEIKQGLKEPCFFVRCISSDSRQFMGMRRFMKNQFLIRYFPESGEDLRSECYMVADRMIQCLEYICITTKDMLRGTQINHQVTEDGLDFYVNYDFFVYKVKAEEAVMKSLKSETAVK